MLTFTSPAASAASGIPESDNMADVIDALKRLERVGSENSKTTQKLITAAAELAEKIVAQYAPEVNVSEVGKNIAYCISDGRLTYDKRYVAEDRSAALAFSEDIAAGLLDSIADDLEERTAESASAIETLCEKGHLEVLKLRSLLKQPPPK